MSSRYGGVKSPPARSAQRGTVSEPGGHKVAARDADIKIFSDLMRERKRLNDRQNEQSVGAGKVVDTVPRRNDMAELIARPDSPIFKQHTLEKSHSNSHSDVQVTLNSEQHLRISLGSNIANATSESANLKSVESIVAVIQRIVMNQANDKEPKQWLIQVGIEGKPVMDIELEYLGNEEWRLGLGADGKRQESTELDSDTTFYENLDELYFNIESGLKVLCPGLRLSVIRIE